MITRLLIARHGNTFGPGDVVTRLGTTDLPLAESGLLQGRKLGAWLKENDLIPDYIVTSKLQRTLQTAEQAQTTMGTHLPVEALSMFNEIDYGPDENRPEQDVITRLGAEVLQEWEKQAKVPGGWNVDPETIINDWQHFANRLIEQYSGKTVLVVTSNGIARFAPYLTGDFQAFAAKYPIKIATGGVCLFENKSPSNLWQCLRWNVKA